MSTQPFYHDNADTDSGPDILEIGVDEAGRGPLFGRVYTAAVILPKSGFDYSRMKDSKRFSGEKKILDAEMYIKEHALAWSVSFCDEKRIDEINILHATIESMHRSVQSVTKDGCDSSTYFILVDGNYFTPYTFLTGDMLDVIDHVTIKGGDDKYSAIAAASILAKCGRDRYIRELCAEHPLLDERYGIASNKGYGAKRHMDGIAAHGISQFHRTSYKPCQGPDLNEV